MSTEMEEWWFRIILPGLLLTSVAILWGLVAHYILRDVDVKITYTHGHMRCPLCGGSRIFCEDLAKVLCSDCGTVSDMYEAIRAGEEKQVVAKQPDPRPDRYEERHRLHSDRPR